MKTYHPEGSGPPKFQCTICDKKYMTKGSLNHHNTTQHRDHYAKYDCLVCSKVCTNLKQIYQHWKLCHPEKLFESIYWGYGCSKCGKKSSNQAYLDEHERRCQVKTSTNLEVEDSTSSDVNQESGKGWWPLAWRLPKGLQINGLKPQQERVETECFSFSPGELDQSSGDTKTEQMNHGLESALHSGFNHKNEIPSDQIKTESMDYSDPLGLGAIEAVKDPSLALSLQATQHNGSEGNKENIAAISVPDWDEIQKMVGKINSEVKASENGEVKKEGQDMKFEFDPLEDVDVHFV